MENIKIDKNEEIMFIEVLKSLLYSFIGIFIFFIPININGTRLTAIYHFAYRLQDSNRGFVVMTFIILTMLVVIKEVMSNKESEDNINKIQLYIKVISILILVLIFYNQNSILNISDRNAAILEEIVLGTLTIVSISSVFLPFLMNYGTLEIVEAYCQKFMRKTFKISGKNIVIIMIYLVTDVYTGLFMVNQLYKKGKLRENELFIMSMYFSIGSFMMMNYVRDELKLNQIIIIITGIILLLLSNFIMVRIYPASKKKKSYYIKTNYKECSFKGGDRIIKALDVNIKNRSKENILKRISESFSECIKLQISLIPNLIILLFISFFILEKIEFYELYNKVLETVYTLLNYTETEKISMYLYYGLINNVIGVDRVHELIKESSEIVAILSIIGGISISTNYIFIKSSNMPINNKEFIIAYIQRILIILFLYSIVNNLYGGYIL